MSYDAAQGLTFLLGSGIRVGLALLFLSAGLQKLRSKERFALALGEYKLLPSHWITSLSVGIPAAEIAVGVGLLIPAAYQSAAIAGVLLLLVFSAAMTVALKRGQQIDCGCRVMPGSPGQTLTISQVLRNIGLILLLGGVKLAVDAPKAAMTTLDQIVSFLVVIGFLLVGVTAARLLQAIRNVKPTTRLSAKQTESTSVASSQ